MRRAQAGDGLGEHDDVPGLVTDLGQRVVGPRVLRVLVVGPAGEHLDQQDLEPQPRATGRTYPSEKGVA